MEKRLKNLLALLLAIFLGFVAVILFRSQRVEFYDKITDGVLTLVFISVGVLVVLSYAMITYLKSSSKEEKQEALLSMLRPHRFNPLAIAGGIIVVIIFYLILIPSGTYKTFGSVSISSIWAALVVITFDILVLLFSYKIMQLGGRGISHQQKMILATIFMFFVVMGFMFFLFDIVRAIVAFPPEVLFFGIIAAVIVILVLLPSLVKRGL